MMTHMLVQYHGILNTKSLAILLMIVLLPLDELVWFDTKDCDKVNEVILLHHLPLHSEQITIAQIQQESL